jgi:hypothetical protein
MPGRSRLKHDCGRSATSTGGKCLANVHAKPCLIPEPLQTLRSEDKGQAGACGQDAGHPLHGAGGSYEEGGKSRQRPYREQQFEQQRRCTSSDDATLTGCGVPQVSRLPGLIRTVSAITAPVS